VGTRRHTFARALEDAGAKVSEIQVQLGRECLDTTGRSLARLHQGELRHHARVAALYGLEAPTTPTPASQASPAVETGASDQVARPARLPERPERPERPEPET
jgi:hypothetical protein